MKCIGRIMKTINTHVTTWAVIVAATVYIVTGDVKNSTKIESVEGSVVETKSSVKENRKEIGKLRRDVDSINGKVDRIGDAVEDIKKSIDRMGKP